MNRICFVLSLRGCPPGRGSHGVSSPCGLKAKVTGTRIHGKSGGGLSRVAIRNKLVYFIRLRNKPLRTKQKAFATEVRQRLF